MKDKEREILKQVNNFFNIDLKEVNYKYCPFDAHNDKYIVEIKHRNTFYNDVLIEFKKYSFNKLYAKENNKQFIYIVGFETDIFLFNISEINNNYNWRWEVMPKQTEFQDNEKIYKYVGYINIKLATVQIQKK